MQQSIRCENRNDPNGNPAGGFVVGEGIYINWQNGPLGRGPDRPWITYCTRTSDKIEERA